MKKEGLIIKQIFLLSSLILFATNSFAQSDFFYVTGKVINGESQQEVNNTFVELFRAKDSSLVSFQNTNDLGVYEFRQVKGGAYFIRVSHPQYAVITTEEISISDDLIDKNFVLEESNFELDEVVITKHKPFATLEGNKMNILVDRIPGIEGDNTLELLSMLPGIWVEGDNSLTINGSNNVIILINGKRQGFRNSQDIDLLKTISANNIEKVEIISGGSAKYDATGGSVINIITKNKMLEGVSANLSSSISVNKRFSNSNNLFVSLTTGKLNAIGSVSYGKSRGYYDEKGTAFFDSNTGDSKETMQLYDEDYSLKNTALSFYTNLIYQFDAKNELSLNLSSYGNDKSSYLSQNSIYQGAQNFQLNYKNKKEIKDNLTNINLNYIHTLDTSGTKLMTNIAYLDGYIKEKQDYSNEYLLSQEAQDSIVLGYGDIPLTGSQFIGQFDVEIPIKALFLELGTKYTDSKLDNFVAYTNIQNEHEELDTERSDSITYKENVFAAYALTSTKLGKVTLKGGARLERTDYRSSYISYSTISENNYVNILPNVSLSYKGNNFSSILKFTSGITRPNYTYLNPYKYYINEFEYREGNPDLRPLKRNTLILENSFWDFLNVSVGYHKYNDMIFVVKKRLDESLYTVSRPENAVALNDFFTSISLYYRLLDNTWSGQLSFYGETYNYDIKEEFITNVDDLDQFTYYNIRFNNNYKLFSFIDVFNRFSYRSNANFYQSYQNNRWRLDLGANFKLLKDKLRLTIAVNDIFDTYNYDNISYYNNYKNNYVRNLDLTRFRMSLTYNIDHGWKKTKAFSQEKNSEELNRYKN